MTAEEREKIKREAYMKALSMKQTGANPEVIYARLEKQGIPADIAEEVANNFVAHLAAKKEDELPKHMTKVSLVLRLIGIFFPRP